MSIDKKTVQHVAKLARLKLNDSEAEKFTSQLDRILEHASQLNGLQTDHIEASEHAFQTKTVLREDHPQVFNEVASMLKNGPEVEGHFYVVPQILGESDS